MKTFYILLPLLIVACSSSRKLESIKHNGITEQIFTDGPGQGKPGKCYAKMMLNKSAVWTEILCLKELTKEIIEQIQRDLVRLHYKISEDEFAKSQMGDATRKAITDFQMKNNMAYGGLDWATINRLKL